MKTLKNFDMTQEELIIALCSYLPYHLLGRDAFGKIREMKVIYLTGTIIAQEIDKLSDKISDIFINQVK